MKIEFLREIASRVLNEALGESYKEEEAYEPVAGLAKAVFGVAPTNTKTDFGAKFASNFTSDVNDIHANIEIKGDGHISLHATVFTAEDSKAVEKKFRDWESKANSYWSSHKNELFKFNAKVDKFVEGRKTSFSMIAHWERISPPRRPVGLTTVGKLMLGK